MDQSPLIWPQDNDDLEPLRRALVGKRIVSVQGEELRGLKLQVEGGGHVRLLDTSGDTPGYEVSDAA